MDPRPNRAPCVGRIDREHPVLLAVATKAIAPRHKITLETELFDHVFCIILKTISFKSPRPRANRIETLGKFQRTWARVEKILKPSKRGLLVEVLGLEFEAK